MHRARTTIHAALASAAGLSFVLAFAGCGSDDGALPTDTTTPSADAQPSPAPSSPPPVDDAGADAAPEPAQDAAPAPPPVKKTLTFTWQGELVDYWCGPSATRMALSTRLASPPTQATLAQELPTSTNGTDDISLVVKELDKRLPGASYVTKYLPDPPSAQQRAALVADLVSLVSKGWPMVANVVSGWRPATYPQSGTIYHYVAVVGYDANGDKALIADPAAEGHGGLDPAWDNVPRSYWISTADLGTWIGGKGYTAPHP